MKKPPLWLPPEWRAACPHVASFFPDFTLVDDAAGAARLERWEEGDWVVPAFNGRRIPLAMVARGLAPLAAAGAAPFAAAEVAATWQRAFGVAAPAQLLADLAWTRFADPFTGRPGTALDAVALLALWRRAETENRRISAFLGMAGWKRAAIATAFGHGAGHAPFAKNPAEALATPGIILAWASSVPPALDAMARVWRVEDGFIRSIGLGVNFAPAASLAVDAEGIHYDPSRPSGLERILAETDFTPLLPRASALRQAIADRNITKYNLGGAAGLPATPGRRRVLVVGQVEDDASIRKGAGAVKTNAALLAAARAAEPDAFIIYKPHPDVQTGYRRGYLPPRDARRWADLALKGGNIGTLIGQVDRLHTITSLAGFEALLRGVAVTCWGMPFYAGWGLTDDREPPPRRGRPLSLNELVAGCLILYPRYQDPVTLLPCPPEVLLDRLAEPALWPLLSPARRGYVLWWKLQGQLLRAARHWGLWQR